MSRHDDDDDDDYDDDVCVCLCVHISRCVLMCIFHISIILDKTFFTPPRNRGGVIFSLQFVCVCVFVCVCLCVCLLFSCEQNSSRTDVPI